MFVIYRKKMIHPMYLSNWIKSGIIYIKDLIFEGSNLDEHFLLTKIKHKINIFIEILELKQALLPFADLIRQNDNLQQQKVDTAIRIRIKTMPDKKLAEFNFKVMQNIQICGHYLNKWQDSVNENCEICNTVHDIPHLLFDCDLAQSIWKKVGKALDYKLNKYEIIIIY